MMERAARWALENEVSLADAKKALQSCMISEALRRTDGNVSRAARDLGVHRNTLFNELRKAKA
jgi:transcriptional regulator of acetoin/glycerol metabolism